MITQHDYTARFNTHTQTDTVDHIKINELTALLNRAEAGDIDALRQAEDLFLGEFPVLSRTVTTAICGRIRKIQNLLGCKPYQHRNNTMTPRHDYTARLLALSKGSTFDTQTWQVMLRFAKRACLHARNTHCYPSQKSNMERAQRRYRRAAKYAENKGVTAEEFLSFWKSL